MYTDRQKDTQVDRKQAEIMIYKDRKKRRERDDIRRQIEREDENDNKNRQIEREAEKIIDR